MSQKSVPLQKLPSSLALQSASWLHAHSLTPATHKPPLHKSPMVHGFPSVHVPLPGKCTQPLELSHVSFVHGLPSSQPLIVVLPIQLPPRHSSKSVHAELSLQSAVLASCTQPILGSQLSLVQGLASSQLTPPPEQLPARQMSPTVQEFPSSQLAVSGFKADWQTPSFTSQLVAMHAAPGQTLALPTHVL